ncbi:MAG: hypothetical protein RJA10_1620 [Pseudomonadota bacterium]
MAAINLSSSYSQDFDTLAATGTSSTLPDGWVIAETGANANATYTAGTGSGNAGDTYSFGASGSGERALGMLQSGSLIPLLGVSFVNATGGSLSSLDISYVGEFWRLGTAARTDRLDFQYSLDATSLTNGTWIDVDALDFTTPSSAAPTGAKDGNASGNFQTLSSSIGGLSLASGATIWFRWKDDNASGADDGLAVDNFTLTAATAPAAPLVSVAALDASASEAGPDAGSFRFTRTGNTGSALTVAYTVGGNAGAGDYTPALTGTVVIPAGSASVDLTITPVDDTDTEGSETVSLTLVDGAAYDLGASSSASVTIADNDTAPTRISSIQGSGAVSPLTGQSVTVEAVVVGDFQGSSGLVGFFLQEEDADTDGNAATSEGLFVFQGGNSTPVNVGDLVRVTGTVIEFTSTGTQLTELSSVSSVQVLSGGHPLPTAATLALPVATLDQLEALEGMRVNVPGTLTVTDTFTLGRFGEVQLAVDGPGNEPGTDARLDQFTQFHQPSVSGNAAYLAQQKLRSILLDDGLSTQNPGSVIGRDGQPLSAGNTLRGGDTVTGLTGVLDQRFGEYRIQPTTSVDFDAANPRSDSPPAVGGTVQVAALNVLNYFNGPGFPTSRGATTAAEYTRQLDKLVAAISGLGAEVVGLLEMENDGYGADSSIQTLVDALNAKAGAGTWAFVNPGRPLLGGDAIAVGLIYKPAAVTPVGSAAVLDKAVDARFDSDNQRPSLAQTFQSNETGATFTPVINHLKSKGSAAALPGDADSGDGQGLSNATRTAAAEALVDWLAGNPTGLGGNGYLVLGDLNAYAQEDPLRAIEEGADDVAGSADDFANLVSDSTYSYSFDGQWGALDHALANGELANLVAGAGKWHINADEPTVLDYNVEFKSVAQQAGYYAPDAFRSSDHDPVLVGLNLGRSLVGSSRGELIEGTAGPDRIRPGQGRDAVVGGDGHDRFVFGSLLDFFDTIADFEVGSDRLDISALMASVGAGNADPVGGGYLKTAALPALNTFGVNLALAYTLVLFDPDGQAGPAAARPMVDLIGVSVTDPSVLLLAQGAG